MKTILERKEKEFEKVNTLVHDLRKECDILKEDCLNYNIYQSGVAKEVLRSISQEINSATFLTQLSHNSKEYAKGMKVILEQCLSALQQK